MIKILDKKSFSILSIAIIIIAAVWVGGITIYQSKLLKEQIETKWRIEDETVNWNVYRNEDYDFEIKYPRNWEFIEVQEQRIKNPEKIMKGIIGFGPRGKDYYYKEYIIKPVTIGISRGQFAEVLNLQFPSTYENEIGEILYWFKNPKKENLKVVITDETGFIVEDATERKELKAIIKRMISTFRFF